MKEHMNKKYINIGIVGLAVVILIIAGLMDYKKGIDKDIENINLEDNSSITDEATTPINDDKTIDNFSKPPTGQINNKEKFNTALSKGSEAFNQEDYTKAINYFNEALTYNKSDVVYARLFSVYGVEGNWTKALEMINKAIEINPSYTDYWNDKLVVMDEKSGTTFVDLKNIYNQGLSKVDPKTKINLITNFARIAENNGEKTEAIAVWNKAIEVYPQNKEIYQKEIDRLNK